MAESTPLLRLNDLGLYCEAGDFHVDPWKPVDRAVITHAHADHACWGCRRYLTSNEGRHVLRVRMGREAVIDAVGFGEAVEIGGVRVSLHPAGHILGSSQVRVEHRGEVWVVSGDYKVEPDADLRPRSIPCACHTPSSPNRPSACRSIDGRPRPKSSTRSTPGGGANRDDGRASLLFGYSLGKAQRLLAGLDPDDRSDLHAWSGREAEPGVSRVGRRPCLRRSMPGRCVRDGLGGVYDRRAAVGPRHPLDSRKFGASSSGFASGWMRIRGPGGGRPSIAGSSCRTTSIGSACSGRSRRPGRRSRPRHSRLFCRGRPPAPRARARRAGTRDALRRRAGFASRAPEAELDVDPDDDDDADPNAAEAGAPVRGGGTS